MLNALRQAAGTWVAKLLLLMLVLSFAVWGISGTLVSGTGDAVLSAGKSRVTVTEYRLAYDRQINLLSQQAGSRITREQAQLFGIDQQVNAQLVAGVVLDEQAREMTLGLSKDRIAALTAEDPAFQDASGRFDRNLFDLVLRNVGMRPEDYLRNREQVATRQQIVEAVSDGVAVPDTFLTALALHQGETRDVSYVAIPKSALGAAPEPTDQQLSEFFEANKDDYRAPEYRKLTYVKLEADDIADPASVTQDAARAEYDRVINRYTTPEKRVVDQLVFSSQADAEAARAKLDAGMSFDDLAAELGKSAADIQVGDVTRSQISDQKLAEPVFALPENSVSGIVAGAFGPVIARVGAVTPESVRPFTEVEAEIKNELAVADASQHIFDVHDGVEDALGGGATLREAADRFGLDVVTVDAVDRNALRPDGTIVDTLPQSRDLLSEAFQTEANVENLPIQVSNGGYVWYNVEAVTPSRERSLDEVRDTVVADWRAQTTAEQLSSKAEELRKRVADGTTLQTIADELGLSVDIQRGLKRGTDDAVFGTAGVEAAFGGPEDLVGTTPGAAADTQILFKVDAANEPLGAGAESIPEQGRQAQGQALADDLLEQFVARLQGIYPVMLNQAAQRQAMQF